MLVLGTYLSASSGLKRFCSRRSSAVLLALLLGTSAARPLRTPLPLTSTGASCCSVATPWACAGCTKAAAASAAAPRHHGLAGKEKLVMILLQ